jgi:Fe-S-cluster containining protein
MNQGDQKEFTIQAITDLEKFNFSCHEKVSCFNQCCHRIDVIITPIDAIRIKNQLGISSDEFIAKYTAFQKIKDTDIPLLKLKAQDPSSGKCIFLGEKWCDIYESRPVVCRNYPTGIAAQNPLSDELDQPFFIVKEEMCKGHFESKHWTLTQWKENQGSIGLEEKNSSWLKTIARLKPLKLSDDQDQKMNMFVMVSYDLDTFRTFVFNSPFLQRFDVDADTVELIEKDDEALLDFGFKWLEFSLFAEGPFKPKVE